MFDNLYYPDDRDRAIFGESYDPPEKFTHGGWHQVVGIPKEYPDSDGQAVAIDECRMPTRFFRLRMLPGVNSIGVPYRTDITLSTGSGDDMGRILFELGKQIAAGMIGFDIAEPES
jgi:hypothetical protein